MPTDDETFDPWELDEGGGLLDDFDGTITEARFGTDSKYNGGATPCLILEVETGNEAVPFITNLYPLPTGWEIADGGKRTVAEDPDKTPKLRKNSGIGTLIAHAVEAGAGPDLRAAGDPTEAGTWEGLRFHWKQKSGGEGTFAWKRTLPTEYLGKGKAGGGSGKGTTATATKAKPAASASSGNGAGADSGDGSAVTLPKPLEVKIKKAAKAAEDFDSFIEAAFAIDGIDGNADYEALVCDEAQFEAWKA